MQYLSSLYPDNPIKIGHAYYANCRFNAKKQAVTKAVGNPSVISDFERCLKRLDLEENLGQKINFQVCLGTKISESDPKPTKYINSKSWGKDYPKEQNWDGLIWVTVNAPIQAVKLLIEDRFILRYGIKIGGNDIKNYVGSHAIAFDLDNDPSIDWQQTKAIAEERMITPGVIHYSPSGNPDNNKLRLILFFDEFITDYDRVNNLQCAINELFPNAASAIHDPCRIYYPTLNREVIYFDTELNSFELLTQTYPYTPSESIKTQLSTTEDNTEDSERSTKNKRFFDHLVNNVFNGDASLIFEEIPKWCEHHGFTLDNWKEHTSPGDNLIQYRGRDPINPNDSTTGTSFSVGWAPDNTYWYKSDRSGTNGDLPDLWYRLSASLWEVEKSTRNWYKAMSEICEFYGIPDLTVTLQREWEENGKAEKLGFVSNSLDECLNVAALDKGKYVLDAHKCWQLFLESYGDKILYEDCSKNYWLYEVEKEYWTENSLEFFRGFIHDFFLKFERVRFVPVVDLLTPSFINNLDTLIKKSFPRSLMCKVFPENTEMIYCSNKAYNVTTKELIDYSPEIKNTYKLKWNYQPSTGIGIEAFRAYLKYITVDPDCVDEVYQWMALAVQGKAYLSKFALSFVGDPNAGKTGLAETFASLLSPANDSSFNPVKSLDGSVLLEEGTRFATNQLVGTLVGHIDEFTGLPYKSTGSLLKKLIGNPTEDPRGFKMVAEKKGGDFYDFFCRVALITTGQNFPKLPAEDNGFKRRFMFVRVRLNPTTNHDVFNKIKDSEILQDFFSWCLEQDTRENINHFRDLSRKIANDHLSIKNHWAYKNVILMQMTNNKYYNFVAENLVSDPNGKMSASNLFNLYQNWCLTESNEVPGTQKTFSINLVSALSSIFNLKPDECKKRSSSGWYYHGISVRQIGDDED